VAFSGSRSRFGLADHFCLPCSYQIPPPTKGPIAWARST